MDTDFKINITDLQLRNLAEHIPSDKAFDLGLSLGLTKTDLSSIGDGVSNPVKKTFQVLDCWRTNLDPFLIRWRNKVDGRQTERLKLETAMRQSGLEIFIPCIDAHVTRKENDSGDTHPIVNLSLPNGAKDVDRKQEIDVLVILSSDNDDVIKNHHKQLYRLVSHPADTDQNWTRICHLKSVFEPHGQLSNIELLPLCFTIDVVSLDSLNHLRRSIENRHSETAMLGSLFGEDGSSYDQRTIQLRLELDKQSYSNGVRFFKDLDQTSFIDDLNSAMVLEGASTFSSAEDSNTRVSPKPEAELQESQQMGVNLVWRNVSQHNFGF